MLDINGSAHFIIVDAFGVDQSKCPIISWMKLSWRYRGGGDFEVELNFLRKCKSLLGSML